MGWNWLRTFWLDFVCIWQLYCILLFTYVGVSMSSWALLYVVMPAVFVIIFRWGIHTCTYIHRPTEYVRKAYRRQLHRGSRKMSGTTGAKMILSRYNFSTSLLHRMVKKVKILLSVKQKFTKMLLRWSHWESLPHGWKIASKNLGVGLYHQTSLGLCPQTLVMGSRCVYSPWSWQILDPPLTEMIYLTTFNDSSSRPIRCRAT